MLLEMVLAAVWRLDYRAQDTGKRSRWQRGARRRNGGLDWSTEIRRKLQSGIPICKMGTLVGWQGGVEEVVVVSGLKAGGSACGGYFAINMASSTRR